MAGIVVSLTKKMRRGVRRAKEWMMEYAYLVTLASVIAIIAVTAVYTERLKTKESSVQAAAQAAEIGDTPTPHVTPLDTIAPLQAHYFSPNPGGTTVWPLDGNVIRPYDAQQVVHWAALGAYRVHPAMDIAGDEGEAVCCAMDGTVQSALRDELWGWRVSIEQTDGRLAAYAGLKTAAVQKGQNVTRGQILGTLLAHIPCEAEMDAHLHLELSRDGVLQDPEGMLPIR